MDDQTRSGIIEESWKVHQVVEESYLNHSAKKGDDSWPEKQRLLLADMAIHLLQTSLKPGQLDLEKLKNNVSSIMIISDQYLPEAELKRASEKIHNQ